MTFAVHRSDEPTARERGRGVRARARARDPALDRGLRADVRRDRRLGRGHPGAGLGARGARRAWRRPPTCRCEALLAVNARTEVLAGAGPTECSVVGAGGLLAQNWDWHPELSESTVIWIVETGSGWFVTLSEAGMLAKIGLNDAGLGVCLNLLRSSEDGGHDGTPIHILLRQVLATCRSVDEAVALLASTKVTASSAVTVAQPGDVATVELSPGGANVLRGSVGAHTNHFLEPPQARPRHDGLREHDAAARGRPQRAAARRAALPRRAPERRLPPSRREPAVGRAGRHRRVGRDEPRRAALPRRGRPALHARARADHAAARLLPVGSQRYQRGDRPASRRSRASDSQIGTCQMSISSIFTPMNARMNASPSDR